MAINGALYINVTPPLPRISGQITPGTNYLRFNGSRGAARGSLQRGSRGVVVGWKTASPGRAPRTRSALPRESPGIYGALQPLAVTPTCGERTESLVATWRRAPFHIRPFFLATRGARRPAVTGPQHGSNTTLTARNHSTLHVPPFLDG